MNSEHYESQLLNSPEYAEFSAHLVDLQEDIKKLNLAEEKMETVRHLLKEHHELSLDYVEKMYKQAMIDCVVLLKELKVIQSMLPMKKGNFMELNEFKDRLFDILNDTDDLPIADIIVNDKENEIKILMNDHSSFVITSKSSGIQFIQKPVNL